MTIQRTTDVWEAISESPEEAQRLRDWAEAMDAVLARKERRSSQLPKPPNDSV
ncbi:hypothetical protein ACWF9G_20440 [Nocardia sp. NPDC055029]